MSKTTAPKSPSGRATSSVRHADSRFRRRIILGVAALFSLSTFVIPLSSQSARAADCADINIIFARGSGESLNDTSYRTFKNELEPYLAGFNYQFYELGSQSYGGYRYDAVSVGFDSPENFLTMLGAKIGAGNSYKFGASVNRGINELKTYLTQTLASCPNAQFALAGYSQGAMVISKALRSLDATHIVSVATIADPKLYLPEGAGSSPAACSDPDSLSSYRAYVPDCYAYQGIFNGYNPYLPDSSYTNKVSTWCNYHDLICSSKINWEDIMAPHTNYVSDGRYQDIAELMASQIFSAQGQEFVSQNSTSSHDLAILIDSTGSMGSLIDRYKQETLALATNILAAGGRVALYEYRDLSDPFEPILHCGFDECNVDILTRELDKIQADGGGDYAESLLSASLTALNSLQWKIGANKTILAVTDAGFLSPDRDGATLSQVIARSLEIDPVHIYVLTPELLDEGLQELVTSTGGQISVTHSELSFAIENAAPEATVFDDGRTEQATAINDLEFVAGEDSVEITYHTDAYRILVVLNDSILGFTDQTTLQIDELDRTVDNIVTLIPFSLSGDKGDSTSVTIPSVEPSTIDADSTAPATSTTPATTGTIGVPRSGFPQKS